MTTPIASYDGPTWHALAACRGYDPELFFPIGKTGPARTETRQVKAVCAVCPVRRDCLDFALETRQEYGIWGGYDEDERRILRRSRHLGSSLTEQRLPLDASAT